MGIEQPPYNPPADWPVHLRRLHRQSRDPRLRTFYDRGVAAPSTPVAEVPLVAMDFETTGLDPIDNDILSIGLVPLSLERIRCREGRHWLLSPTGPLPGSSVVIHGITHSDINTAPEFLRIVDELLQILAGKVVVVHYRPIERHFLANALLTHIGEQIEFPVIDTFELERRAMEARRGWLGKLMGRPLGSLRLGECRQRYGLPAYQPHHALTDALATAELLQAQIAHHYRPDTPVGDLWC